MRKTLSFLLSFMFIFSVFSMSASAYENKDSDTQQSIEYLEDGSYFVTIIEENTLSRATKSGSKTATYYNGSGVAQWSIKVTGSFSYSGSTFSATSASGNVTYHVSGCSISNQSSYVSGNSAIAYATVNCTGTSTYKSVTLTCSASGVLS